MKTYLNALLIVCIAAVTACSDGNNDQVLKSREINGKPQDHDWGYYS